MSSPSTDRVVRSVLIAALTVMALALAGAGLAQRSSFDHLRTTFPLTGVHAVTPCESCHVGGQMAGTPRQCEYCHRPGSRIAATAKPMRHVVTTQACDVCHRSAATWAGARYSHVGVAPGSCMSCHNGMAAPGKPTRHVQTTSSCDSCHRSLAWLPAGFNHAGVAAGTCANCHNGSTATGKPPTHIVTTQSCDICHRTGVAWIPTQFNHTGIAAGTCATCHNGVNAVGKPPTHVATTLSCDQCHRTGVAWLPAGFNHAGVVAGSCGTCHVAGGPGLARPANHIPYETQILNGASLACDACHTSTTTFTAQRMNHNNSQGNGSGNCKGCHQTGTTFLGTMQRNSLTHQSRTGVTDCSQAGCHRPLGGTGSTYVRWL